MDEIGYAKLIAAMSHARSLAGSSNREVSSQAWKVEQEIRTLQRLLARQEMQDLAQYIAEEVEGREE